jgi:caffeoyl-CoA O-methyltransferase
MSINSPIIAQYVQRYIQDIITKESAVAKKLREETLKLPGARMITSPDQVAFLAMLMKLTGTRKAIEVGTFTGYGTLAMAMALPQGGKIIACDVNEETSAIAKHYWAEANVTDRIDLRIAPALDTLTHLLDEGMAGQFDFVFIDADKNAYDGYYEASLKLIRRGGIIALDNMLWNGTVAQEDVQDAQTRTLRALNLKLRDDTRVDVCLLTIADGLSVVVKH